MGSCLLNLKQAPEPAAEGFEHEPRRLLEYPQGTLTVFNGGGWGEGGGRGAWWEWTENDPGNGLGLNWFLFSIEDWVHPQPGWMFKWENNVGLDGARSNAVPNEADGQRIEAQKGRIYWLYYYTLKLSQLKFLAGWSFSNWERHWYVLN